jgi:tetratricopeptide (TPR) repeat protein
MSEPQQATQRGLRIAVVAFGALVCVLLFAADKSNLSNRKAADLAAPADASEGISEAALPPLAPDERVDAWRAALPGAGEAEKTALLDSLAQALEARNRPDVAAIYARQLAESDGTPRSAQRAGKLHLAATGLPHVQADSALSLSYAQAAISLLEGVVAQDSSNEAALLDLGLAYIASRLPENSMRGILTIRRVTELNPANAEAQYRLGLFSRETGQWERAAERFEKVLELEPDNLAALYQLAYARAQTGQTSGLRPMIERVIDGAREPELKQAARELLNVVP